MLVTGGTRGIGRLSAIRAAREGANVVVADILEKEGDAAGIFKSMHSQVRQILKQGRGGAIVNIGSIAGLIGLVRAVQQERAADPALQTWACSGRRAC